MKSTSSCKYLLQFHLIFVVKYRKSLLVGELKERMLSILKEIPKSYDFEIKNCQLDKNHIHFLISSKPHVSISQIVRVLKQLSTVYIWREFEDKLSKHFWKERTFWSDGYFITSIGNASEKTIQKYIDEQGS